MTDFKRGNNIEGNIILFIHRIQHWIYKKNSKILNILIAPFLSILNHLIIQWIFNCIIPKEANIGSGVSLPHPFGIIITPYACIGSNVKILHFVTIGINELSATPPKKIEIGDRVFISAHAQIIGNDLKIGNDAVIGANAVVTTDVPERGVYVGIPARPINKTIK